MVVKLVFVDGGDLGFQGNTQFRGVGGSEFSQGDTPPTFVFLNGNVLVHDQWPELL